MNKGQETQELLEDWNRLCEKDKMETDHNDDTRINNSLLDQSQSLKLPNFLDDTCVPKF